MHEETRLVASTFCKDELASQIVDILPQLTHSDNEHWEIRAEVSVAQSLGFPTLSLLHKCPQRIAFPSRNPNTLTRPETHLRQEDEGKRVA